jgi:hypothetical protein
VKKISISVVLLQLFALVLGVDVKAEDSATKSFSADPKIQAVAEAYALDAVDYSAKTFRVNLDWSDESIGKVEIVLSKISASYDAASPKPTADQVMTFAKMFGSYVGEVYRRHHDATWGMVHLDGQTFPGLRTGSGVNFWPWGRVFERITKGSEDNISDYYAALLTKSSK